MSDTAYDTLYADFCHLWQALHDEAKRRDWCDEYDQFIEEVNCSLTNKIPVPARKHTVEFAIKFTVSLDEDDAIHFEDQMYRILGNVVNDNKSIIYNHDKVTDVDVDMIGVEPA